MARLGDLLDRIADARIVSGGADLVVDDVRDDSRKVRPGDLFVAVPGTKADGRRFIDEALGKGAVAVLTEGEAAADLARRTTLVVVPSVRRALGRLAANRFPETGSLTLSAVTGTNGKTTTTYLVEAMLAAAGRPTGVIGTVGYRFGGRVREAALTTPGALELFANLADMAAAGARDVVMEASSIALEQDRLAGCRFRVAALTNVTQDHLDYHGTMARYFAAKTILFRDLMVPGAGVSVFFTDDDQGRAMRQAATGPVLTLSREQTGADVVVSEKRMSLDGIRLRLVTPQGPLELASPLVGDFNVANLLTAVGMALGHGVPVEAIAAGAARVRGVPGRLERVANEAGVLCVVDYAHTPDALERALGVLRPLCQGKLICVFGCGGDRDRSKRPLMGEAAARLADVALVTSDNPRTEEPGAIIDMILAGVRRAGRPLRSAAELRAGQAGYHVEPDRGAAISRAVGLARMGDVVLLAGKGHEDYQIIGTEKTHFDDREVAAAAFAARRSA
jgi:UDP-N-acetylmuramoyl-L-alanyl-D-glutamate--2,6-diaminopimelate ligase